jgi:SAM-dependent methyltransferase
VAIHQTAAEGFGRAASAYERGRPGYPNDAVECMATTLGITLGATVIDLGAGTGKFSRMLLRTGARVIAVEPVAAMRSELVRAAPGVDVVEGTAEAIPCDDGSADAVTAAQAFHWFAGAESIKEIHRVLRVGGGLGLIWNRRDRADPLQASMDAILQRYRGAAPAHERDRWREAMSATPLFGPAGQHQFRHVQVVDADRLVDRVLSISFIATLADDQRVAVADEVRTLARGEARIALPYTTDVFLFRRV